MRAPPAGGPWVSCPYDPWSKTRGGCISLLMIVALFFCYVPPTGAVEINDTSYYVGASPYPMLFDPLGVGYGMDVIPSIGASPYPMLFDPVGVVNAL